MDYARLLIVYPACMWTKIKTHKNWCNANLLSLIVLCLNPISFNTLLSDVLLWRKHHHSEVLTVDRVTNQRLERSNSPTKIFNSNIFSFLSYNECVFRLIASWLKLSSSTRIREHLYLPWWLDELSGLLQTAFVPFSWHRKPAFLVVLHLHFYNRWLWNSYVTKWISNPAAKNWKIFITSDLRDSLLHIGGNFWLIRFLLKVVT